MIETARLRRVSARGRIVLPESPRSPVVRTPPFGGGIGGGDSPGFPAPALPLTSAASASARCSARGRDTSLARIAALGVSFMVGTASS